MAEAATPRLFGLPPGADFPAELVEGILSRHATADPTTLARVQLFVNTARMARRVTRLFQAKGSLLLPKIRLITDIAVLAPQPTAPVVPDLRRRLELSALIARLIDSDPALAPRAATFDLAGSLAALFDEMVFEGVAPGTLAGLDVADQSGHWARSLRFIAIVEGFLSRTGETTSARRLRAAAEALVERWQSDPLDSPVILAGSTGSRGTTALLMQGVACLPQGAVVLPGFDFEQPAAIWDRLDDPLLSEDHPQYRFARRMADLGLAPADVQRWTEADPRRDRNRLLSLALRPAPVTDQWRSEGPALGPLPAATDGMSLIEADSPRLEALAIALRLRQAVEDGQRAALITPDRMLTRQVTAALDRWRLVPDDSAGHPLGLTAPGRFLRHLTGLMGERLTAEPLLTLLKHPLCNSAPGQRGDHLANTRALELWLRRKGPPFLTGPALMDWAKDRGAERIAWAGWIARSLAPLAEAPRAPLGTHLDALRSAANALSDGTGTAPGRLWTGEAGEKALNVLDQLEAEALHAGEMTVIEFRALLDALLAADEVRDTQTAHPGVTIWGTLEARVQGADLVILAGLNDGTWPQLPAPDPWLNRALRQQAGLLLPERQVGLSAHDFQQAAAAPEVVLTRATRDAEAETVVSRWLNRLTNLMNGLPGTQGPEALAAMRARGARWLEMARTLDAAFDPVPPERRPAPRPPVGARPTQFSVTRIKTLIRDPYAIYARDILKLRPLDPLRQEPDAPLRGEVLHTIFERFIKACPDPAAPGAKAQLQQIAAETLAEEVPWPTARRIWAAKLARVVDWFLETEIQRRAEADPLLIERRGDFAVPGTPVTLTGKADRIARRQDGRLLIYDYKTGTPPSAKEMEHFDKQLLLEAAMAEAGAFPGVPAAPVAAVAHIGLGAKPVFTPLPLRDHEAETPLDPDRTVLELRRLIDSFAVRSKGYPSRRAMHKTWNDGDYDHLARHGEWDDSDAPSPEDVG
ncbi:double-strand break repair protein AddB [Oceaniglobus roseus]|uniref:double-strand break repair protein AddB n=1 Tax=Oceaniglobus roseus TaxID=1737570 RepID=UPI000C7ECFE5|nr:double-strand break repair protein AddB [Kandeliimicrobium roseum]